MRFFSDNAAPVHPQVMETMAAANSLDTAYDGDAWSKKLDQAFSDLFEKPVKALWIPSGTAANCLALAELCPPYGGVVCHRDAHIQNDECGAPEFYTAGAKLLLAEGDGAKLTPDTIRATIDAIAKDVHRVQPHALSITNATEYGRVYTPAEVAAIGEVARAYKLPLHMDGARFANAVAHCGCSPADMTWRAGVDVLSFGFIKNGGMSAEALIFFNGDAGATPQARRPRVLQGPLPRRAAAGAAGGRPVARQRGQRQRRRAIAGGRRGRPPDPPRRGERGVPARDAAGSRVAAGQGLRLLRLGGRRDPAGDVVGSATGCDPALGGGDRGLVTGAAAERPQSSRLSVLLPFGLVTLIWGSTWLVIRDQIAVVPAVWSVTYRFIIAGALMIAVALVRREAFPRDARGLAVVAAVGLGQFCVNFNFVYRAEAHITSGLVAVVFALLLLPNALLSRIVLGQRMGRQLLLGSIIAMAGVALLIVREARVDPAGPRETLIGVALTLCGILGSSLANVTQATRTAKTYPMFATVGCAMLLGAAVDGLLAWHFAGPPVIEHRTGYYVGILYLAVFASALAFPLYYGIIRAIGPAKAAYNSVIVPVIAMLLSTVFEGYRWSGLAVAGAVVCAAGLVIALTARRPDR
jgi:threonine aldolase/drug/metabolite transporter (DMT)-like permease